MITGRGGNDSTGSELTSNPNPPGGTDPSGGNVKYVDTLLSYAFKPDSSEPLFVAPGQSIFQLTEDDLNRARLGQVTSKKITSSSTSETANKFSAEVGIKGTYGAFSGSASISTSNMNQRHVKTFRIDQIIRAEEYTMTLLPVHPHKKLRPEVRDYLLNESPKRIVANIGSFFASQLSVGGVLQLSVVSEQTDSETATEISASFEAKYGNGLSLIQGSASTTIQRQERNQCSSMSYE